MASSLDHLHEGVWSFLDEPLEDRIIRLYMPKWVSYARGDEALGRMEHLLRHPSCGRMPCMLLYGDSDIGKTMIVEKFVRGHPNICDEFGEIESARSSGCRCRPSRATASSSHKSSRHLAIEHLSPNAPMTWTFLACVCCIASRPRS